MTVHVHCHDEAVADVHNSAGSPKWRPDISLEVPHVRRPLVVSGDTSEPVKGTGTDMTRKSIQETERRSYTRYTWECVSALLLTFPPVAKAARQRRHAHIDQSNLHRLRSDPSHCIVFIHSHRHSPP